MSRWTQRLVLVLILPPLLYSAALNASLLEIRANLRTIISSSVVLGAEVAPTDRRALERELDHEEGLLP